MYVVYRFLQYSCPPDYFPTQMHTWVNFDSQTENILNFINNKTMHILIHTSASGVPGAIYWQTSNIVFFSGGVGEINEIEIVFTT